MNFKSVTMILNKLLFIVAISEFIVIILNLKLPTKIGNILIIFLIVTSMSEFIETRKLRKLTYPLIIIWSLIGMNIIGKLIYNRVLYIGLAVLSFIIAMIFLYKDLILTNKEKSSLH